MQLLSEVEKKTQADLYIKQLQLHWLLQVTKAINYNLPSDQLFEIYETVMRDHLRVNKLSLYVFEGEWKKMLAYGETEGSALLNPVQHFPELAGMQFTNDRMPEWVQGYESIIPVYHNQEPLAYAFIADLQNDRIQNLKEILPFIHTITNIIVVAIENKRLTRETINQAQMQKELELAARMQNMLFPAHLPSNKCIDLAATYLPHQQVGGDYYDYIEISEDELLICLADVSGKGMSAALLMSNFQANLHAKTPSIKSLQQLIIALNASVNKSAKGEKFITVFLAVINTKTQIIHYVNAGHNQPVLYINGTFTPLDKGTTGLGMFEELPFVNEGLAYFPKGAILFCYTDGIIEQENDKGEIFGLDKLTDLLKINADVYTMKDLHFRLIDEFRNFRKNVEGLDDVTLLSCRSV
ncbi:MAG: PP2C family protein-serine/threonine phosphatase [Bacteroidota bacterium]